MLRKTMNAGSRALAAIAFAGATLAAGPLMAQIKIGAPLALTGGLADEGKKQSVAYDMWLKRVNAAGGLAAMRTNRLPQHALRNAVLPVITTVGVETAFLFGGLIVTETVFNIPGVARFLVEAIRWRDYPMVQNLVMFIAIVVVTVNLIVDLTYMLVDPRIRYSE